MALATPHNLGPKCCSAAAVGIQSREEVKSKETGKLKAPQIVGIRDPPYTRIVIEKYPANLADYFEKLYVSDTKHRFGARCQRLIL